MKSIVFIFLFVVSVCTPLHAADPDYQAILKSLSVKQKIGQITQPDVGWITPEEVRDHDIGTILRGGGTLSGLYDDQSLENNKPLDWAKMVQRYKEAALTSKSKIPLLFAIDAVHGHNNVTGATLFPHNIGLGATHNPELLRSIGLSTAWEVFVTGIDWNFSPTVAVARNEKWGRTYESFSEKTSIVTDLSVSYIEGLQSELVLGFSIIGTAKHWIGDGATTRGIDQGDANISLEELKKIHMPPYVAAIEAGVRTMMVSFNSWKGMKVHGHRFLVQNLLKEELGFKGVVITDWNGIDQIETPADLSEDDKYMYQIAKAFDAGIDVYMVPDKWKKFITLSEKLVDNFAKGIRPSLDPKRLDDAVLRVLKLKHETKIASKPMPLELYSKFKNKFGSVEHREIAAKAAKESAVRLKGSQKDIITPQDTVLVIGELARNTGHQAGGWSLAWQGVERNIPGSLSILNGLQIKQQTHSFKLDFSKDGHTTLNPSKIILVIGESPYAEGKGDRTEDGANLSEEHINLLKKALSFNVPVTVILINGRPLLLPQEMDEVSSLISYWLPGTMGSAIADLLVGEEDFSGKLSFSWPANKDQIDFDYRSSHIPWKYPIGYGL